VRLRADLVRDGNAEAPHREIRLLLSSAHSRFHLGNDSQRETYHDHTSPLRKISYLLSSPQVIVVNSDSPYHTLVEQHVQ
jgi:hypothetical protein